MKYFIWAKCQKEYVALLFCNIQSHNAQYAVIIAKGHFPQLAGLKYTRHTVTESV